MRILKSRLRVTAAPLVILALTLAGCHMGQQDPVNGLISHTFDSANWQQIPRPIKNQVESITFVHTVTFDSSGTALSANEVARLHEFLQKSGIHNGARIEIDGPRDQGGYHDPLTTDRLTAIESELARIGLRGEVPLRPVISLAKPDSAVAVTVTRAMVIPPDCGAPQPGHATRPDYVYSCSNTANLGMMIADPLDLERGRALGASDGQALAPAIQRYRAGQTKPLSASGL